MVERAGSGAHDRAAAAAADADHPDLARCADQPALPLSLSLFISRHCIVNADVDRLDDISKLEQSVNQSATVLIFLSRHYFASANCRCMSMPSAVS